MALKVKAVDRRVNVTLCVMNEAKGNALPAQNAGRAFNDAHRKVGFSNLIQ